MPKPPGSGTLGDEITDLRARITELTRTKHRAPACVVRLTRDVRLPSGVQFAYADWTATDDPYAMFTPGGTTPARIGIDRAGYYRVHFHSAVTGPNAPASGKVTRNAADTASAIAADARQVLTTTGDGAVLDAHRCRIWLDAGDALYWSNWCGGTNATLRSQVSGVPTEITIHYVGSG